MLFLRPFVSLRRSEGFIFITTLLLIFVMGMALMGATQLVSQERAASTNQYLMQTANYIGIAGLEYAKSRLDRGLSPNVTDKTLGSSSFDVVSDPENRQITVTSHSGRSHRSQTIQSNFSKDCLQFNTNSVEVNGDELKRIKLIKSCNTQVIASRIKITWNAHTCVTSQTHDPLTNDLRECEQNGYVENGGASVESINLASDGGYPMVYSRYWGVGSPLTPAHSGDWIDIEDVSFTENTYYVTGNEWAHGIRFIMPIPPGTLFTFVIEFADASQLEHTFQVPH